MENKQINEDFIKNNIYLLRFIYMIRINLPSNNLFYLVMFIMGYFGAIICSRIPEMSINSNYFFLNKILSNFLIFGKNFKVLDSNYEFHCILGLIILLIYVFFCVYCFFYMKTRYKKVTSLKDYNLQKLGRERKTEKLLFKIISYIFIIIIFFRQYILEYYFFSIYSFILYFSGEFQDDSNFNENKYNRNCYKQIYSYFYKYNYLLCFVISIITIVLIMSLLLLFMLLNSIKGLFLNYGFSFSDNKKYIATKMILLSLQPFYGISVIFNDSEKKYIAAVFDALLIFFCLFSFYSCFHQFGFYPNFVTNTSLFMEFFIFVSSISQLIIFFSGMNHNSNAFIILRLCIEIIDAILLMYLFNYEVDKHNLNLFSKNIFSTNFKSISKGGLYYYMKIYQTYEKDKNKYYTQMFRVIRTHVNSCNKIDCPGKKLISKNISESVYIPVSIPKNRKNLPNKNLNKLFNRDLCGDLSESDSLKTAQTEDNYFANFNYHEEESLKSDNFLKILKSHKTIKRLKEEEQKKAKRDSFLNPSILNEKNKLSDKQFQMIFEQEIINRIDYLNKRKNYSYMEDYIFIHLQYLLKIKNNYYLTLYYVGKYNTSGIKWSFSTRYFLYEYKKYLISVFYNQLNLANIDEIANKYRKENHFLHDVVNYVSYCLVLRQLIVYSCQNLKTLFSLRKDLHNNIVLKSYQSSKTKNVLKSAENLQKYIKKINIVLKRHHNKYCRKLVSPELSYLVSNFYIFVMNKIPGEIKQYVEPKFDFNSIIDQLESEYKLFNLIHPFVLALTEKDTFNVVYFSNLVCAKLGYLSNELLNKDFHQKIFPGYKFIKEHELIMKQFLFCDNNTVKRDNTFLKTKDGYLVSVKLTLKKFPTFFNDFFYVVDTEFNDDFYSSEINKNFNRYSFILDDGFDFMHMTRNFYDDFEFNVKMFKDLHTNFLDFFCVDTNKIYKKIQELGRNNPILLKNNKNIINFLKENDAFSIFQNIDYDNVFELRSVTKIENISFKSIMFEDKIDKNKIIKSLPNFAKLIEENGLDCEWYQHIENFKQRLLVEDIIEEEDSCDESIESSYRKKEIIKNSFIHNASPQNNNGIKKNSTSSTFISFNFNPDNFKNENKIKNTNFMNTNIVVTIDRGFKVIYSLKRICNIRYCIVDLCEKTNYINDENKNELMEDNDIDKNQTQNIFLQKTTTYKKIMKNGKLTLKKNTNTDTISLIDDSDIPKNNKLYENSDVLLSPTSKKDISKSKTHFNIEEKVNQKKISNDNTKELIKKKSELQIEEEEKIKKSKQKKRITYMKSYIQKRKNLNDINDPNNINKDIKKKLSNNLLRQKTTSEAPEIGRFNIDNVKIDSNFEDSINSSDVNQNDQKNKNGKNALKSMNSFERNEKYLINSFDLLNSSNNSKDRKKNNGDEEKISFISQDELENHFKANHRKNGIYRSIEFIIFLILFIIATVKLIMLIISFSTNENLIKLISLFEIIKMDLYSSAIILMGECANMTNQKEDKNLAKTIFETKNKEISQHIAELLIQFKKISNNKNFENIILYIYSNIDTVELNNDWSPKIRNNSNFMRELNYLEYIFNEISYEDDIYEKCDFEKTFFQIFNDTNNTIYKQVGSPSLTQKFLYYIMRNYLFSIKDIFSLIEIEMCKAQIKVVNKYFRIALEISIWFCGLLVFNEVIILLKSHLDMKFIVKIFLYLYHYEKKQLQFEYEIYYLEKVTEEFNIDNICLLENIKKVDSYYLFVINMAKSKMNYIDKNINQNKKDENFKNNKSLSANNKISSDQKSMASSILNQSNASNNSSMMQFLKNKNNQSINNLNNNQNDSNLNNFNNKYSFNLNDNSIININNQKISEDEKMFKENEESILIIKKNKKLIPKTIILVMCLSLSGTVLFICLILSNVIKLYNNKSLWKYSVYISMNYLQRIPKISELGIYSYFFVLAGHFDKIGSDNKIEYIKNMPNYMNYFTKLDGYDNSDLISANFNDSLFANILIDNLRIKKNIEFSLQDKNHKKYFTEYKKWNQKLNDNGYFCYNAAMGSRRLTDLEPLNISNFFENVDLMAEICYNCNQKIIDEGLDLELNYIYQELTYAFVDFCGENDLEKARDKFYKDSDVQRIINDMKLPFKLAFDTLTVSVVQDMKTISGIIIRDEVYNLVGTYIFGFFLMLALSSFAYFTDKDKILFEFLAKILQKN